MNIIVNCKTRTISATTSKYTYSTKYKVSDDPDRASTSVDKWYANEIITKGSNTISVKIYIDNGSIDIVISNDIETIKRFWLKEITKNTKYCWHISNE